ncbi:hypothetical protein PYW08_006806 [Mythimna loreyi]|uniref:Uncharacterized protein n=1 Tax=Mythimna loreyi TaxID=667449 RepID=A0ACC2R8L4_9NEOP|nr:hypothetical protein PYW08_006806 [Mythimna loreyi]
MKKSAKKKTTRTRTVQEIIDSDDELPSEYIEIPFVPAYLMDDRFDHIGTENVDKETVNEIIEETEQEKAEKINKQYRTKQQNKERTSNGRTVVDIGYLNKKDTFCFQCLEPYTGKKTQKWFFNFLTVKDLNASYTFLNTCLVPSYGTATLCK